MDGRRGQRPLDSYEDQGKEDQRRSFGQDREVYGQAEAGTQANGKEVGLEMVNRGQLGDYTSEVK